MDSKNLMETDSFIVETLVSTPMVAAFSSALENMSFRYSPYILLGGYSASSYGGRPSAEKRLAECEANQREKWVASSTAPPMVLARMLMM